jgi:hypothetical protein
MFGSFLRASWLVLAPPKFTRPTGADIVMESITLKTRNERYGDVTTVIICGWLDGLDYSNESRHPLPYGLGTGECGGP